MKTRFLPFGQKPEAGGEHRRSMRRRNQIHVVDDMADRMHFMGIALEKEDFGVHLHCSVADFARDYSDACAAAVFVDVHLGEEDATDLLDLFRARRLTADLYLVSGDRDALAYAVRYAEELGLRVAGTLEKPFSSKMVLACLKRREQQFDAALAELDMDEAIANGWVYPVLQPKLDIATGRIESAELLSRMAHPELGIVLPHKFIGGMTVAQSRALFLRCVDFVARRVVRTGGREPIRISVNADPATLVVSRDRIRELAREAPGLVRNLVIEITEETVAEVTEEQLKALYQMSFDGIRFSIDDFGIGHSNISRLARVPWTELKLDKSIVQGCADVPSRLTVVRAVIGMAHDLGRRVVAEGVESIDDLKCLEAVLCDEAQGYLVGRPMKPEKFDEYLKHYNAALEPAAETPSEAVGA